MSQTATARYLVTYDIADQKRLSRLFRFLKKQGVPVQYSVFRVRCTGRELERLRFELTKVLDSDDRLMVIRLCAGCAGRVTVQGKDLAPFETEVPACKIV